MSSPRRPHTTRLLLVQSNKPPSLLPKPSPGERESAEPKRDIPVEMVVEPPQELPTAQNEEKSQKHSALDALGLVISGKVKKDSGDPIARKAYDIVTQSKRTHRELKTLMDIARQEALLEWNKVIDHKKYYSKSGKISAREMDVDEQFGCFETLSPIAEETAPRDQEMKEMFSTAVMETAVFREVSKRIREQTRELAMQRSSHSD